MSIMIAEVYEALLEAGASESKAKAAAESLAGYENRFAKIEPDLPVIKWMVGAVIAGIISLVIRAYVI
ncbi:MAG: integrase [SAR324 cluster bacterium]|nr:integrase [SAR324 cluster bacterium]